MYTKGDMVYHTPIEGENSTGEGVFTVVDTDYEGPFSFGVPVAIDSNAMGDGYEWTSDESLRPATPEEIAQELLK